MNHSDFHLGLEFISSGGFKWRCTDVGTRTIVAVRLGRKDSAWYKGPPYIVEESVFDEREIERCHLTNEEAIVASMREMKETGHPGYPAEVVIRMLEARRDDQYPHSAVLRFDRVTVDGEILHPFAGRKEDDQWTIDLYLPFSGSFDQMSERDFIALPIATTRHIHARASRN